MDQLGLNAVSETSPTKKCERRRPRATNLPAMAMVQFVRDGFEPWCPTLLLEPAKHAVAMDATLMKLPGVVQVRAVRHCQRQCSPCPLW